jgi:hypothetical protein
LTLRVAVRVRGLPPAGVKVIDIVTRRRWCFFPGRGDVEGLATGPDGNLWIADFFYGATIGSGPTIDRFGVGVHAASLAAGCCGVRSAGHAAAM